MTCRLVGFVFSSFHFVFYDPFLGQRPYVTSCLLSQSIPCHRAGIRPRNGLSRPVSWAGYQNLIEGGKNPLPHKMALACEVDGSLWWLLKPFLSLQRRIQGENPRVAFGFQFDGFRFVEAPNTSANRLEDAIVTYDSRTKCERVQSMINLVKGKPRSSSPRRAKNVMRERALGHDRIFADYFADNFTCLNLHFRHRFRMQHYLFLKVVDVVIAHDYFFFKRQMVQTCQAFKYSKVHYCNPYVGIWTCSKCNK